MLSVSTSHQIMKIKYSILLLTSFLLYTKVSIADTSVVENTTVAYNGLVTPFSILAQPAIPVNETEVKAGLLYDAVNGKIVWQKNMSTPFPIASLTKMMVAFLAAEDIRAGLFTWE